MASKAFSKGHERVTTNPQIWFNLICQPTLCLLGVHKIHTMKQTHKSSYCKKKVKLQGYSDILDPHQPSPSPAARGNHGCFSEKPRTMEDRSEQTHKRKACFIKTCDSHIENTFKTLLWKAYQIIKYQYLYIDINIYYKVVLIYRKAFWFWWGNLKDLERL